MINQFLNGLKNVSVFNQDTFNKTISRDTGAYRIVIQSEGSNTLTPEDDGIEVVGVLNGGINLSTSTNWGELELDSDLGSLMSNVPLLTELKEAVGVVSTLSGVKVESNLQSKKFYTGGSFLNLPLSFKVLDDDDSGKAISAYLILMALSMPREDASYSIKNLIDKILGPIADKLKSNEFVEAGETWLKKLYKEVIQNGPYLVKTGDMAVRQGFSEIINEDIKVTQSPPTIRIEIGNWLVLENMIIDSVDANFSPIMTKVGPQSVELNLNVSSRNKLILGKDGFVNGRGRIKIVSNSSKKVNDKAKSINPQ